MIHGFPPAICAFGDARAVECGGLENRCAVTPYYDRRARHHAGHEVRGPWPTPARDGIRAIVIEVALKYPMWGHRKFAWLARHEHALDVCDATCLRILREAGLKLPVDYARERRDLAGARREAFVELPTRRNRVWQMDFFELETSGGGTWRSGDVIDYATKLVLAGPIQRATRMLTPIPARVPPRPPPPSSCARTRAPGG